MSNGALESLDKIHAYLLGRSIYAGVNEDIETIRKQLKRAEELQSKLDAAEKALEKAIAVAAHNSVMYPNDPFDYQSIVKQFEQTLTQIRNKP